MAEAQRFEIRYPKYTRKSRRPYCSNASSPSKDVMLIGYKVYGKGREDAVSLLCFSGLGLQTWNRRKGTASSHCEGSSAG
jgi:hypothetical protein